MRHDYDLPPDWDALSDTEKSKWMTRERCRRQNERITDSPVDKARQKAKESIIRRLRANGYIDAEEYNNLQG